MKIKLFGGKINISINIEANMDKEDSEFIKKAHEKAKELVDKAVKAFEPVIKIEKDSKSEREESER